jgi:prepilin-type N-terminal cleavage/methylation domain-containing protein
MFAVKFFRHEARMKNQKSKIKNHAFVRGFTIIECLIGLAISAMLLTAVAVAFNASAINYRENEDMFWAVNNARQALTRMTSQLRTGSKVLPTAPSNQCSFFTAANEDVTYDWRSAEKRLYVKMNATGQQYKLCENVTAASFTKMPTDDNSDCKGVQISLTVQSGNSQRTLAAAAVIRRNL